MATSNQVLVSEAVQHNRFSAEFFDARYVFEPKIGATWLPIGRLLRKCEYGISIAMNSVGRGFPIFRMNELDGCFAQRPAKFANIPSLLFHKYQLQTNDVLFNRTNSFDFVGRTGIVKDQTDCTFASYLIRLVPDTAQLLPEFLTVYLNTPFGIGQVKRRAMRSINQANVSGSEIRKVLIPKFPLDCQQVIADLVNSAHTLLRESEQSYRQAVNGLEMELGLASLEFERPTGYVTTFGAIERSRRMDSQHFQPRFDKLLTHLAQLPSSRLRDLKIYNRRGMQPIYVFGGDIRVVNSKHLGVQHIDYEGLERTSISHFAAAPFAHIRPEDILIYSTGAYVGRTNVYLDSEPAMASNHVNILRVVDGIDRAYLSLVLQSVVGQFQTLMHVRGSTQVELYPADIDRFIIPLIDVHKQKEIGDLIRDSLAKQRESKLFLEQAKAHVEALIEEAIER